MALFSRSTPVELPAGNTEDGPRPPAWYPYPTWAGEGDPFHVPLELTVEDRGERLRVSGLREAFASGRFEPSEGLVAGFRSGESWTLPFSSEPRRPAMVINHRDPQALTSPPQSPDRDEVAWRFAHVWRAVVKAKVTEIRMAVFSATRPCPACGREISIGGVRDKWLPGYGRIMGCDECLEVLSLLTAAEMVNHHDRLEQLQQHARELVAARLGLELEPSESA